MILIRLIIGAAILLNSIHSAVAEQLTATIAPSRIAVSYNYEGGSVYVFGRVEGPKRASLYYDLVATLRGPAQEVSIWRKERVAGLWINKPSRIFVSVPSVLGVYSNRPLNLIAGEDTLRQESLGLRNVILSGRAADDADQDVMNLIRLRTEGGLYNEQPNAVTFLTPAVFRADIPLPSNAAIGPYTVDLTLLANGQMNAHTTLSFTVEKVGVEEFIVQAAKDHGLAYGLTTVFAALGTGLLASIAFRRS